MTCTKRQIELLLRYASVITQEAAAAKAGMSLSTAKRYLKTKGNRKKKLPESRTWRTRTDPFAGVWDEVKALLERDHGLQAQTLMGWLVETYPTQFKIEQVRTLRRRVHDWRVLEGPERREVMFAQDIQPGRQSQSDYTHCNELKVTIAGEDFPHMVFHFMLPFSRWEFVWICFSESYETLTTGYERAVRALGAVAPEHRTDNLAAAVPIGQHGSFQPNWEQFLDHFDAQPSSNFPGESHQNGSVEKSHDLFKNAIDQRLRLRFSRDFASVEEYDRFLQAAVTERNRLRTDRLTEEMKLLKPLPEAEWYEPRQYTVTVSGWSTVAINGAVYSVPSRFIGQKLRALVSKRSVRVYYGTHPVLQTDRQESGGKCINYHHIIFHLLRKPGAFRNYQFREELFPRVVFRRAYDALLAIDDERADKEYLKILNTAAMEGEELVAAVLTKMLDSRILPKSERVSQYCKRPTSVPDVHVSEPELSGYDALLFSTTLKESNQ